MALLALAIAVQNTCPYGYAGKTAVAAPYVHNCPLKNNQPTRQDGQNKVADDFLDMNHPFVFVAAPVDEMVKAFAPAGKAGIIKLAGHKDIFLNTPYRPPEI